MKRNKSEQIEVFASKDDINQRYINQRYINFVLCAQRAFGEQWLDRGSRKMIYDMLVSSILITRLFVRAPTLAKLAKRVYGWGVLNEGKLEYIQSIPHPFFSEQYQRIKSAESLQVLSEDERDEQAIKLTEFRQEGFYRAGDSGLLWSSKAPVFFELQSGASISVIDGKMTVDVDSVQFAGISIMKSNRWHSAINGKEKAVQVETCKYPRHVQELESGCVVM